MREKLEECFNRLQSLEIKPTLSNMEILVQTLYDLRDMYNNLKEGDEGGSQADSEGRDSH